MKRGKADEGAREEDEVKAMISGERERERELEWRQVEPGRRVKRGKAEGVREEAEVKTMISGERDRERDGVEPDRVESNGR